ncbi:MAG: cysteine peptidase family C39 domain-containing protein [Treponemataceae bacterium]|nr:cysteine peptidase family C39 domain-containing protein [Treponemataceae bacterium]
MAYAQAVPGAPHTNDTGRAEEDYTISFKDMQDLLASHGFVSRAFRFSYAQLVKAARSYAPIILHWEDREGHFVLCLGAEEEYLVIADPAEGVYWLSRDDALDHWKGHALLVQHPTLFKNQFALEKTVQETRLRKERLQFFSELQRGGYR